MRNVAMAHHWWMNISSPSTFFTGNLGAGIQQISSVLFQLKILLMLSPLQSFARIPFLLLIHNWRNSNNLPAIIGTSATHIFPLAFGDRPATGVVDFFHPVIFAPPLNKGCSPGAASIKVGLVA